MSYRLGVDVGGTFTDVLLIDDDDRGDLARQDRLDHRTTSRVGVLRGIEKARRRRGRARARSPRSCTAPPSRPTRSSRARARRSAWSPPRASARCCRSPARSCPAASPAGSSGPSPSRWPPLEHTVEALERVGTDGSVVRRRSTRTTSGPRSRRLRERGIESLCVCLINSFANADHEKRIGATRRARSCPACRSRCPRRCCPRCASTSAPSRPWPTATCSRRSRRYVSSLAEPAERARHHAELSILRSDGGLASAHGRRRQPGVAAAVRPGRRRHRRGLGRRAGRLPRLPHLRHGRHVHRRRPRAGPQAAHRARDRRSPTSRCAPRSVDVRTVGAGGGSIAHVPPLTQALRVGPQSAGAVPGPGGVRRRRHRADRHRRQRRAGLPAHRAGRRRDRARRRRRAQGGADHRRRDLARERRGGRRRHRRHRQREHVRRAAAGLGAAGLRPPRLRPRRLRRRRPAARQRARQAHRLAGRSSSRPPRACSTPTATR